MYKKDKRYIVGAVLTAASLLILAVTFVLMGMGSDKAVVWFYFSLPALVIGSFIMQAVKRMYEKADMDGTKPMPYFYYFKTAVRKMRKKGIADTVKKGVTALLSAAVLVTLLLYGYFSYSMKAIKREPVYVVNQTRYDEYYAMWKIALSGENTEVAHFFFEAMDRYHDLNADSNKRIGEYKEKRKTTAVVGCAVLAADVIFVAVCGIVTHCRRKADEKDRDK